MSGGSVAEHAASCGAAIGRVVGGGGLVHVGGVREQPRLAHKHLKRGRGGVVKARGRGDGRQGLGRL